MKKWKFYLRLAPMVVIMALFLLGATARLYNLQITHREENKKQAEKRQARMVALPATRGELLDRYGRPLVTNYTTYALRIDLNRLLIASDDPNEVIDRLTRLMKEQGVRYEDTFPILPDPYHFKFNIGEKEKTYLKQFTEKLGWPEDMAAPELMEKIKELFGISDEYAQADARRIAAIRYEMELRRVLQTNEPYYYIPDYQFATEVDMTIVGMVREQDFPGVMVETVPVREYRTQYAAHLLGMVGRIPEGRAAEYKEKEYAADELVGLGGLEEGLEKWLRGKPGWREEETNTSGKITNILNSKKPEPGNNCFLTIDILLQEKVEHALEEGILSLREQGERGGLIDKHLAAGGAAVLMDLRTGEILAMASYPTYDLINFAENFEELNQDPMSPMLNRAVAAAYEPGSTFKMASAMAALEAEVITPTSTIFDEVVYTRYAPSYTPKCTGSHGSINVADALRVSCNYFFYESAYRTKIETMNVYAKKLGFGVKTNVELPGERDGVLAGPEYCEKQGLYWYDGDVLQAAIGQSYNLITPIQLCSYVATLANGGVRCKPHLLNMVKSFDYASTIYVETMEVVERLELKDGTLEAILSGMRMVCEPGGTAARTFADYPYPVGGKTGSAQTLIDGRPANGVFVAFAPFDDPQVAVAVVVEKGGSGSAVAPIARDVFDAYFQSQETMSKRMPENQLHG
ncbi:MAG: penicillin-binding transpeptidase domain-containing protein [Oscillospiraceae bacterium]|nr:penicillin-binding transpeptidase domain-containing protein [Oscillospiraceae bacterium]